MEEIEIQKIIDDHRAIIKQRIKEGKGRLQLHLGCGRAIKGGCVNIDISPVHNPDIIFDLSKGIPFHKKTVTTIFSRDFLEHLGSEERNFMINECWRVLKVGGVAVHEVPDAAFPGGKAFQDPTHKSFFTVGTPFYWMKKHSSGRWEAYGQNYGFNGFRLVKAEYIKHKLNAQPTGWLRMKFFR